MSLHDALQAELDAYLASEGEALIAPDGEELLCLPSSPDLGAEFLPGVELENNRIRVRISKSQLPARPVLQTLWVCRGQTWRLSALTPYRTAWVLDLEDPGN